jgi:ankyrin repeat protein
MKNLINQKNICQFFISALLLTLAGCGQQAKPSATIPKSEPEKTAIDAQSFLNYALNGKVAEVQGALDAGVDANVRDDQQRTALLMASFNGHTPVVKLLLDKGALLSHRDLAGRTALMYAASGSNVDTVALLLEAGAEVNAADNDEKFTALMLAAAEGQAKVVEVLLKHNADATLRDADGETAREFAVKNGHAEVVRLLAK